jgi:hypothetical protein
MKRLLLILPLLALTACNREPAEAPKGDAPQALPDAQRAARGRPAGFGA